MTKKFEVTFSAPTSLSPSFVYISPSEIYQGYYSVGILHPVSSSGTFQSAAGIAKTFDLKQHLTPNVKDALSWATDWLSKKSGVNASLSEVTV